MPFGRVVLLLQAPKAVVWAELRIELPASVLQVVHDSRVDKVFNNEESLGEDPRALVVPKRTGTSEPSTSILIARTSNTSFSISASIDERATSS